VETSHEGLQEARIQGMGPDKETNIKDEKQSRGENEAKETSKKRIVGEGGKPSSRDF